MTRTPPLPSQVSPRRVAARRRARITAWLALAIGLVAITTTPVGQTVGIALLVIALVLACRPAPVGHGVAAVASLLTALVLALAVIRPSLISIRADWTAVAVLLVGASALVVAAFSSRSVQRIAMGVGGFTLTAIGGTACFVRIVGSYDLLGPRTLGATPLTQIATTLLLGLAFLFFAWGEEDFSESYPSWLPAAVAIAGVAASIFLWRALVLREETELTRRSAGAAGRAAQAVLREVEGARQVLRQFALRETPTDESATIALTQLRPDVPTASVLAILDSLGRPIASLPSLADAAPIAQAVPVRAIARVQGQAPVVVLPIPNDTARLVIHAASCVAGACGGGVAAIISSERLLQRASNELSAAWTITIGAPRVPPPESGTSIQVVPLDFGAAHWVLIARPTAATIGTLRSTLPEVALILGLIMSALLSVTVRLGDRAFRGARLMERMQLQSALDRSTDALWEWDVPRGTLARSPELWRYMGFDPTTMRHTLDEWLELVHPDDRERVSSELWSQVAHDRATFELEYRIATPGGDWHEIVDRGRAVERDHDGRAIRVLGISADVTKARRREQEFREVETLTSMGRVAARVAHEINNPLAGIRNAFLLIKDAVPESHPHYRYVGAIEREVDRIASVTRGLYETYRPEQEGATTAVASVIGDAVALLGEMNRKTKVTIDTDLRDVPPVLMLRGALLRQIVYNLVQNAIDASPAGGVVTVRGRMNGKGMILEVADEGAGVPIGLRDRVFDPFFTTKGSNAENSGMGLGLSMVARSVTAAGGTITVNDNPVGGALFRVILPIDTPINQDVQ